ncbi:MAG: hypothetical protein DWP97_14505 [Calditrichaeota bacterium]|nr:MAG: hypothetical protein DWP97_14505 [Calditrichota bacterium]
MSIPEPAVKRTTLVFTAGLLWAVIGLFLFGRGIANFLPFENSGYIYIGGAILLGILKSQLIFSKIIDKNVQRIKELAPQKDKICIFAFQALESYLIALVMIGLGLFLRTLDIPPMIYGGILILIGTALLLSGLKYIKAKNAV